LFDILGQGNNGKATGGDDLSSFFGFEQETTSKPSKEKDNGRTTAPPTTMQTQIGSGLKKISEDEVASPKNQTETLSHFLDNHDSDSDSDKEKNVAGRLIDQEIEIAGEGTASNETQTTTDNNVIVVNKGQTDALAELHRGTPLLKYPRRRGFPHFKYIQLSKDNSTIQWFSRKKKMDTTRVLVSEVKEILKGQETQVFRKFQQAALEKASFSVVFGHDYKSLDLVAKSTDECDLWVSGLQQLVEIYKKGTDLKSVRQLMVSVSFKDRNRPQSRAGSGRFVRANQLNDKKVDSQELKELKKEMSELRKSFERVKQLSQSADVVKSEEVDNIRLVLSELEERLEELTQEVSDTRDTEMSKRDVWRVSVDLQAIEEKIEVVGESTQKTKRRSNFW